MMSFPLMKARGRIPGFTKEKCPNLWAYTERISQLETYKKAEQIVSTLRTLLVKVRLMKNRRLMKRALSCRCVIGSYAILGSWISFSYTILGCNHE
jgi:hypothetical protein